MPRVCERPKDPEPTDSAEKLHYNLNVFLPVAQLGVDYIFVDSIPEPEHW